MSVIPAAASCRLPAVQLSTRKVWGYRADWGAPVMARCRAMWQIASWRFGIAAAIRTRT